MASIGRLSRITAMAIAVAGLLTIALAATRLAGTLPEIVRLGPDHAGVSGPQSGPDSVSRAASRADLEACRRAFRSGLGTVSPEQSSARLAACVNIAEGFVVLAPPDSYGWLQLAAIRLDRDGPSEPVLDALRRSWQTGRNDGAVALPRLALSLRLARLLEHRDRPFVADDLAAIVRSRADIEMVARLAVSGPRSLAVVRDAMAGMSVDDQQVLVAALKSAADEREPR